MRVLPASTIEAIADPPRWTDVMELALQAMTDKDYKAPDRQHVDIYGNTLLLMPAVGPDLFATKLVSVFQGNLTLNKPVIQGAVLLNDGRTGEPLALLNGSKLTAMRTAGVAAVGVRYLAPEKVKTLGLVGAGVQGRHMAWFALCERNIDEVLVYDENDSSIKGFTDFMTEKVPAIKIKVAKSVKELTECAEVILCSTTSSQPVLPDDINLYDHKTIVAIGSYKSDMRELPDAVFENCGKVWIDTIRAMDESGDLVIPLKNNVLKREQVQPISDLLLGEKELSERSVKVYKTVGHATFDLFAAKLVFEQAEQRGMGDVVEW
jgi:ornithine cyclodeaminase